MRQGGIGPFPAGAHKHERLPRRAASGFAAELAKLMSLPGVADAFERVKHTYHSRIKEIIPAFHNAPADQVVQVRELNNPHVLS
jgi:hypothetical protein